MSGAVNEKRSRGYIVDGGYIVEMTTQPQDAPDAQSSRSRDNTRARVMAAAMDLLTAGGRVAVTTRAVASAANVQAPTLYRLFGDKDGLLHAVAEYGFETYLKEKTFRKPGADPVGDLRAGWVAHIDFGLSNPALYALMYGDPHPGAKSSAAAAAHRILQEHIHRVAIAGRLRVSEERAANLFHAAACGIVLTLLSMPLERRDLALSEIAREAAIAAITIGVPMSESSGAAAAAIALRAALPDVTTLTGAERGLLQEWLDRLAADKP